MVIKEETLIAAGALCLFYVLVQLTNTTTTTAANTGFHYQSVVQFNIDVTQSADW